MDRARLAQLIMHRYGGDPTIQLWHAPPERCWVGKVERKDHDSVTLRNAVLRSTGLAFGQTDIVGVTDDGRFIGIQPLGDGERLRPEQRRWIQHVRAMGGYASVAREIADVQLILHGGEIE